MKAQRPLLNTTSQGPSQLFRCGARTVHWSEKGKIGSRWSYSQLAAELPGLLALSLEDRRLLELEPLKQKRSCSEKCQSSAPLLSLTASPHEAESLLNTVSEPSSPCSVWASTVPPSCRTEQRYLYVLFSCPWISKMAAVRPDSLSSSCSPSAGGSSSRGPFSFRLFQEIWTRGGNMAEARHSRELFPSRWALDAAGYTLTTGFTTFSSEVWQQQQQQAAQTHIHTVNSSLQHCTAFSVILETTWTLITKLLINTAQSSLHILDSPSYETQWAAHGTMSHMDNHTIMDLDTFCFNVWR